MSTNVLQLHPRDNVAVAIAPLPAGQTVTVGQITVNAGQAIAAGNKIALADIPAGQDVVKYGYAIGHATQDITAGELVHVQNVKTNLSGTLEYTYQPKLEPVTPIDDGMTFDGYVRSDGQVGIRNEVWIVPTVGCVNEVAKAMAATMQSRLIAESGVDGVFAWPHPLGCSQLGDDHELTQKILADLVHHPNAGGVLVLGLGCENNTMDSFRQVVGQVDTDRVKFLVAQDVDDEMQMGLDLLEQLVAYAGGFTRQPAPISKLRIGLKCGASDGLSGITGNPLVGRLSDMLVARGGTTVLTEVPEMFGAETLLMNRCINRDIFDKTVKLINDFKEYFLRYNQVVYENPSPGNKAGGITTLEDKSLGCTQKAGTSPVMDVLGYGDRLKTPGLNLLSGPGNDMCAVTVLAAAGAQLILFTTGRGTPLGAPVPTIKVATNTELARRKKNWIDYNAGVLAEGASMDETAADFLQYVLQVASGKTTRNEQLNFREIAIFKDGVTL